MRPRLRLQLPPWQRPTLAALNVLPLPGVGAIVAGWRNPHTTLRRDGALQLALVVLGSWPLILPGAAGLVWAITDAVSIHHADLVPLPPKGAEPVDPPHPRGKLTDARGPPKMGPRT